MNEKVQGVVGIVVFLVACFLLSEKRSAVKLRIVAFGLTLQFVFALIVRTPGSELSEADLIAYVKTKLAGYKCPKRIEFRDSLARTATGKLQKFKLREPYWEGRARHVN